MAKKYESLCIYGRDVEFLSELDLFYKSYIDNIEKIYLSPEEEAKKYRVYLLNNLDELCYVQNQESMESEIQYLIFKKYHQIKDIKYRYLAMHLVTIYQMFEQYLFSIIKHQFKFISFDTKIIESKTDYLEDAECIFKKYGYDFNLNPYYKNIKELKLLENVFKHGLGRSKNILKKNCPRYFKFGEEKLDYSNFYIGTLLNASVNISNDDLKLFVEAIKNFVYMMPKDFLYEYDSK